MTAKELQKRNAKAEHLRVLQTDEGEYFVESAEGKICYRVTFNDVEASCTCGDWSRNIKRDADFQCKHILAVMNAIPTGDMKRAEILEKKRPKLDERWVIDIDGNQFVKYAGLLDLAHQKGIAQIEVEPLQLPDKSNGNFAICRATVTSKIGESFTDIGDANSQNCNAKVGKHLLRLASTRAIARALRTFTNIGLTCLEELADVSDAIGKEAGKGKPKTTKKSPRKNAPKVKSTTADPKASVKKQSSKQKKKAMPKESPKDQPKDESENASKPPMSEAQKRAIYNLSRRRGISVEEVENMSAEQFGVELENLSSRDAAQFIRNLQQAA